MGGELREGGEDDIDLCVALWVRACAERDGVAVAGVAERARKKFDRRQLWLVAGSEDRLDGFALVTEPGTGIATDPEDAAVLGLLAVRPEAQGSGLGRRLLENVIAGLASQRVGEVVLHVLVANERAVRLYESAGWHPIGGPFDHALTRRPTQTYVYKLGAAAV